MLQDFSRGSIPTLFDEHVEYICVLVEGSQRRARTPPPVVSVAAERFGFVVEALREAAREYLIRGEAVDFERPGADGTGKCGVRLSISEDFPGVQGRQFIPPFLSRTHHPRVSGRPRN